jgi:hypothetical protein
LLGTFAKHHCHNPTGSKSETDAFILPLSKDGPQPLSEGASKEDFVADQESDGYEPESPLPNNFADLLSQGSEVALPHEPLSRAQKLEEAAASDGFQSSPRLEPSVTLERKRENEPEEAGPGSKVHRLSCILPFAAVTGHDFPSHSWLFQKPWTYDFRISSVDTKHGLEVLFR